MPAPGAPSAPRAVDRHGVVLLTLSTCACRTPALTAPPRLHPSSPTHPGMHVPLLQAAFIAMVCTKKQEVGQEPVCAEVTCSGAGIHVHVPPYARAGTHARARPDPQSTTLRASLAECAWSHHACCCCLSYSSYHTSLQDVDSSWAHALTVQRFSPPDIRALPAMVQAGKRRPNRNKNRRKKGKKHRPRKTPAEPKVGAVCSHDPIPHS